MKDDPWDLEHLDISDYSKEELESYIRHLETENAALHRLIDDPNAMHSHYLRKCNGWEVWQAERIHWFQETVDKLERENAALREDKEALDWIDENVEAVFFKLEPDKFRLNIRETFKRARAREAKPDA